MDESPTRVALLMQHMNEAYEGKQKLIAQKLERQADYISRLLTGKTRLSGDLAREFEVLLDLPKYWLDGVQQPAISNPRIAHAVKIMEEMDEQQLDVAVKIVDTLAKPGGHTDDERKKAG